MIKFLKISLKMNFIKETHDEKIDGIITERGTKIFNKKDVLICVD